MKFKLIIDTESEEEIVAKVHSASEFTEKIENMIMSYCGNDEISVQGDYETLGLKYTDIECFTVIDRKLFVFDCNGARYRLSNNRRTLSEIEEILPNYFVRINKSSVANGRRISCFKSTFSGGVDAVFKSGNRDYVSRRCFSEIKRRIKK